MKYLIAILLIFTIAAPLNAAEFVWYYRGEVKDRSYDWKKDVYTTLAAKDFIPYTNLVARYREYKVKDEYDIFADIKLGKLLPDKLRLLQGFGVRLQHDMVHPTIRGESYTEDRVYFYYRLSIWKGKMPWQK